MKMRLALLLAVLCLPAFAQVNDGSLKFDFSATISGFFLPGIGQCGNLQECEITFNNIGGKFWNGKLTGPEYTGTGIWLNDKVGFVQQPDNGTGKHNVRFQTGPLVSGDYATGATFGPGGQFHMITGAAPYLACSADIECTFDAHFVWATINRLDLSNRAHTYRFDGELVGAYFDQVVGKLVKIRAHYHQVTGEWNNLLAPPDSQQSWTGGSLDIFTSGPQGQQ